jgi:hypothetical protein
VAWIVLLLPAIVFLLTTWRVRRDFLFAHLPSKAIDLYYEQFFPATSVKRLGKRARRASAELTNRERFKIDFRRLYGRWHYLLPLALLALVAGIGMVATAQSLHSWLGLEPRVKPYPPTAISAFLGAYAWVLYDQFERFRTGDFTPHDVYGGIYRFLIAIPLAISFATFLKDNVGVAIAFLLAAFPTTTILKIMRRLVSQKLGVGENKQGGPLEVEKLQCVGRTNAERYLNEGISTIAELAWTDPIDLTIRTNREFNFVIDSISQALLWVYFEDTVKKLYPLSLRGAQEVCTLLNDLESSDPVIRKGARENLKEAAAAASLNEDSFQYTLTVVKDDPYSQFLFNVWA